LAIVLVGFVLILIAMILQIKAFFSLPESPPAQSAAQFRHSNIKGVLTFSPSSQ